jgi:hypothetical protein
MLDPLPYQPEEEETETEAVVEEITETVPEKRLNFHRTTTSPRLTTTRFK